ncbi:hypothetical protein JR316_0004129 [Psilocybe cubensis]|uniref:Uncharacterized protein n=2 Tax=Psilocybe cubensis TaxID=181762 RepID=A0A8H7Y6K0_PSICU|nr:hypothetical protein JR316_0004129 [Psilocybe cubensis]KAH9484647.1 hypothetical protein JR316_0004129 [Psilocybe cubensis]
MFNDSESHNHVQIEDLIENAFEEIDPAPSLIRIINNHPGYEDIEFLIVDAYIRAIERMPSRGYALPKALKKLEAISADIDNDLASTVYFNADFSNVEASEYGPKNKFLMHSFISGLSIKHNLAQTTTMYALIEKGLDPDGARQKCESFSGITNEIFVVGACIQVLLAGSVLISESAGPNYRTTADIVARQLKSRMEEGVVKEKHAHAVLELAIAHADSGLLANNDRDDVWTLLFPPPSTH